MSILLRESRVALVFLFIAFFSGVLFAVTLMPGFLPVFGLSVLITVLSMRQASVMPGSIFICFFTLLLLVAPYFDMRFDILTVQVSDLYAYWPENYLLLGIVALIMMMLIVHLVSIDSNKVRKFHLALRRIPISALMAVLLLGLVCETILFALGAGRHTAGFNNIPFVGILNTVKSLPELLVVVATFCIVKSPRKRSYAFIIVLTIGMNLVTSLLSGRKEDLLMTGLMALVGFWSSVRMPMRFLVKAIIPLVLIDLFFLPFMYQLRAHPAFNRMDETSTPIDIIEDTISGKYAAQTNPSDFLQRMDLLEPTARYVGKNTTPMYSTRELWTLMACSVIPRFLWADKPLEEPQLGYQFSVSYGYASDVGITAIAFGYLVELHFLFGWFGIVLLILLPALFNSGPLLSMLLKGRAWPIFQLWVMYKFAVFVERTVITGLIETLPYLILALGIEGGLSMLSAILRKLPKMRSKKVVWNVESIPRTSG
jgi:hypothetical protein